MPNYVFRCPPDLMAELEQIVAPIGRDPKP